MKQMIGSHDVKIRTKKYRASIILSVLFFHVHVHGSQDFIQNIDQADKLISSTFRGSPINDGSNINRLKIDALNKQLTAQINAVIALINDDFSGTFTTLANLQCSGSTGTASCDLSGTFTVLAALQSDLDACCAAVIADIATLSNTVVTDFNGTFTAIAAISAGTCDLSGTFTAIAGLQSDLDACCTTLESDFNGTFTAIAASGLCAATPITGVTTIAQPGIYCVANTISGAGPLITIASSDVLLDLNGHLLQATSGNAITIDSSVIRSDIIIKNGFLSGVGSGANGIAASGTSAVLDTSFSDIETSDFATAGISINNFQGLQVLRCTMSHNTGSGAIDTTASTNIVFEDCVFNNNAIDGVLLGFSSCVECIACQANGNLSNGFTFTFVSGNSVNDINLQDCIACGNSATGFVITTSVGTSAELTECFAQHNSIGFDLSGSLGNGLIQDCKAVNNTVCGFRDNTFSLYQYVGNVGQHNDGTPAVATGDSNYCWADLATTSTFTAPSGPGFAPYYQNGRNTNGTMFGISSWDNVTLQ